MKQNSLPFALDLENGKKSKIAIKRLRDATKNQSASRSILDFETAFVPYPLVSGLSLRSTLWHKDRVCVGQLGSCDGESDLSSRDDYTRQ